MLNTPICVASCVGAVLMAAGAAAQVCGPLGSGFIWQNVGGGLNAGASCFEVFDEDGSGPLPPALYVGGRFTLAGGVPCSRVAKWDGHAWSAVGANFPGTCGGVAAMAWFDDDGAGPNPPRLYAASCQTGLPITLVYRLNGSTWEVPPGSPLRGYALDQFKVANGQLWATGSFDFGLTSSRKIAKYDGVAWRDAGDALAIQAMDIDLSTGRLVIGGQFTGVLNPGSTGPFRPNTAYLAAWQTSTWNSAGTLSPLAPVISLIRFDPDGTGPQPGWLYASRQAATPSISRLARKSVVAGSNWELLPPAELPAGVADFVFRAAFDDDGPGPRPSALYASFLYTNEESPLSDPYSYIARLDTTTNTWSPLEAGGIAGTLQFTPRVTKAISYDPDGDGPELPALYICGTFLTAGGTPVNNIAMLAEAPCSTPLSPVITPSTTIAEGSDLTISIQPSGLGPYTYRWFHDGTEVPGETTCTIRKPATPTDAGIYSVEVTRQLCVRMSTSVVLTVGPPCVGDFNHDNIRNPDDLGDFITCYFAEPACGRADFNTDGMINPDDLGDFITEYFSSAC